MFECDCYGAFAVEGDLTRHHLVKKHADGVDIGKYTYLPANSLFGRQVVHGADDGSVCVNVAVLAALRCRSPLPLRVRPG